MTSLEQQPTPPLAGVRVVDLSGPIGAYCTRVLADLGADVVLVEPPEGDPLRRRPPFRDDDPAAPLLFAYYHASKRSVAAGADGVERLAELGAADVVVVSPSASTQPPGWDPETATLGWAPGAIVCAITPFGLTGPNRDWRATPMISFAMGGAMIRVGPPEGPPVTVPGQQQWDEAGLHAAVCVLAALRARDAVGPQTIDLSVHEVATYRDSYIEYYDINGMPPAVRAGAAVRSVGVGVPPSGRYDCADGQFEVAAYQAWHWQAFLDMVGHPSELADPALDEALVRRERFAELRATIQDLLRPFSREDLFERGQAAGLPCSLLNRATDFVADVQLRERGVIVRAATSFGEILMPGPGVRTVPDLACPRSAAPAAPGCDTVVWAPREAPRGTPALAGQALAAGPLEGLRVLSLGTFVAGNALAYVLAELGADVIRLESLTHPAALRSSMYGGSGMVTEPSGAMMTATQLSLARSMRNLAIDLTTAGGRELFARLVGKADVLIENFSAGAAARLGLSFDDLTVLNPRIVLASLSGYGRTGPRRAMSPTGRTFRVSWVCPTPTTTATARSPTT